jgi:hypothetical protein
MNFGKRCRLAPRDYDLCLDPTVHDPDRLHPLLHPYPSDQMAASPVSMGANNLQAVARACGTFCVGKVCRFVHLSGASLTLWTVSGSLPPELPGTAPPAARTRLRECLNSRPLMELPPRVLAD